MAFEFRSLGPLAESAAGSRIFRDWLGDGVRIPGAETVWRAQEELARVLACEAEGKKAIAPVMGSRVPGFDRPEGDCDIVVTGQQPGLLGGPLYTMYKIAATIALARRRSAEGRITLPVFWSADDDDDQREAFDVSCWIPGESSLRSTTPPKRHEGKRRPIPVGDLGSGGAGAEAGEWLAAIAAATGTRQAADLAELWAQARKQDWPWARLQRAALGRIFGEETLVFVSGNDARVHETAEPLYERILEKRESLADLARECGANLEQGGWPAQLSGRSLARPLFRMQDGRRVHLEPGDAAPDAGNLRPGVMLRCLVQDWLLRPAAVVVGPGELAYLRQLDPLYDELGVERAPLVPRLFGWLVPGGMDEEILRGHGKAESDPAVVADWAERASGAAEEALRGILADEVGVDERRAAELAGGRARRYRKGIHTLLQAEAARIADERRPKDPVWVFPEGQRQERRLGSFCAAAIWGDDLATTLVAAAGEHLDRGLRGDWSETLIEVQ